MKKAVCSILILLFSFTSVIEYPSYAQAVKLPSPGTRLKEGAFHEPACLIGLQLPSDDPFHFEFILDKGHGSRDSDRLKEVSEKLIKYFLTALTIPEEDLWVNLSPYEKDRIASFDLAKTMMGRDLLAQDYLLKQLTASLVYPEEDLGRKFWKKVYQQAGVSKEIPVESFNKVWILPDKAIVHEDVSSGTVYIVQATLKVMLREDELAFSKNKNGALIKEASSQSTDQLIRDIVLPVLTREVNEGEHFAVLRQVYHSLILANWYKKRLRQSILAKLYNDQKKIAGVDLKDPSAIAEIYRQYVEAFKKGAYNYIKEEQDELTHLQTARRYFAGGLVMKTELTSPDAAMLGRFWDFLRRIFSRLFRVSVDISPLETVAAPVDSFIPIEPKAEEPTPIPAVRTAQEELRGLMRAFKDIVNARETSDALERIFKLDQDKDPSVSEFILQEIELRTTKKYDIRGKAYILLLEEALRRKLVKACPFFLKVLRRADQDDISRHRQDNHYLSMAEAIIDYGDKDTRKAFAYTAKRLKNDHLRFWILEKFDTKKTVDPVFYEIIYSYTGNEDRFTRRLAVKVLGKIKTAKSRKTLIKALKDMDGLVRDGAIASLELIADQDALAEVRQLAESQPKTRTLYIFDDHSTEVAYTRDYKSDAWNTGNLTFVEKERKDNPAIAKLQRLMNRIEARLRAERRGNRVSFKGKDERLRKFMSFLRGHGLQEDIIVIGGGVRDVLMNRPLNDIDISVAVPLSVPERIALAGTESLATKQQYEYAINVLARLAGALGASLDDFINNEKGKGVDFNGIEIQYAGPVKLRTEDGQDVYVKRNFVEKNSRAIFSSSSGASLLQMGVDANGKLYGRIEALEAYHKGRVQVVGGLKNFSMANILRLYLLKYNFGLKISVEDEDMVREALKGFLSDDRPVRSPAVKQSIQQQLDKLWKITGKAEEIRKEFVDLGIDKALKEKFGIDMAQLSSNVDEDTPVGGIDLSTLQATTEGNEFNGSSRGFDVYLWEDIQQADGFVPVNIRVRPLEFQLLLGKDKNMAGVV